MRFKDKSIVITGGAGGIGCALAETFSKDGGKVMVPEKAIEHLNSTVPLGRVAEPQDISDVIAFLASDAARYIAGECIEISGAKAVY